MDLLFAIYDQLMEIIIILDVDNNIIAVNTCAKNYFADIQENLIGYHYFSKCKELELEPIPYLTEQPVLTQTRDGQWVQWQTTIKPPYKVLVGQRQLRESTEDIYFSSLLNTGYNDGLHIYWMDKEYRLLLCNKAHATRTGFKSIDEIRGKSLFQIVNRLSSNSDIAKKIIDNNQKVINLEYPLSCEEEDPLGNTYFSYKAPFYDQQGNLRGIFGISHDITEIKKSQIELEKSKQTADRYLESVLLSSPCNIYWLDKEGKVIGGNDQQARCIGLSDRFANVGTTVFDTAKRLGWDPELPKKIRAHDLEVMNSRQSSISREKVVLNGEERIFLGCKSPMMDENGEVIGILGISTDITEQVRIEEELEKAKQKAEASSKAKSQFIANISHDIRTPLIGIQGIAAMLAEKAPEQDKPDIRALINTSRELLALLNNAIHSTQFDKDNDKTVPQAFDLYALIDQLVILLTPVAAQKRLSLQILYAEHTPRRFVGRPLLIQRSILNLLGNALKFTEQGQITIQVAVDTQTQIDSPNLFPIQIVVTDTGIGIPEDRLTEIFGRFNRIHPSYENKYKGAGLGLSIAQNFIQELGGKIWAESALGQGSRFYISLPLPSADERMATALAADLDEYVTDEVMTINYSQESTPLIIKQELPNQSALKRILLVEDSPLIQKISANMLNQLNCFVDVAENAERAVAMASLHQYDLIFLDIGLPDHDGYWVAAQIRQLPGAYSATPMIALTAHIEQENQAQCMVDMNGFIPKPLSLEKAQSVLQSLSIDRRP